MSRLLNVLAVAGLLTMGVGCSAAVPATTTAPRPSVTQDVHLQNVRNALHGHRPQDIAPAVQAEWMIDAVGGDRLDIVDELLRWGMDINQPLPVEAEGEQLRLTPLSYAVTGASETTVAGLIERGADVNRASDGLVPLLQTVCAQRYDIAHLLLDRGAQASAADGIVGNTLPIEIALCAQPADGSAPIELLRRAARRGADINAMNRKGSTALVLAVLGGKTDVVRTLLELGAKPGVKTDKGEPIVDVARRKGNPEIVALLMSAPSSSQHVPR